MALGCYIANIEAEMEVVGGQNLMPGDKSQMADHRTSLEEMVSEVEMDLKEVDRRKKCSSRKSR